MIEPQDRARNSLIVVDQESMDNGKMGQEEEKNETAQVITFSLFIIPPVFVTVVCSFLFTWR